MLDIKAAWKNESFTFDNNVFWDVGGECSVVGNEDHSERLIVAWRRCSNSNGNVNTKDEVAVKVGLFDINSTEITEIFTSSEQLNIMHCTVDSSLKTLAMVCETLPSYCYNYSGSSRLDEATEVTYSCYWTPLKISEEDFISVLSLNKESDEMMKVQLLSSTQLLILNPREAIYLYTLPTCESIGYHNTMTSPVLYERLIGPFLWAECNVAANQLFYIYLKNYHQNSDAHDSTESKNNSIRLNPILTGLKFHSGTAYETVLQTPIDLLVPINSLAERGDSSDISTKFNSLSNKIYHPLFKMEVSIFTMPEGEVYVCQGFVNTAAKEVLNSDVEHKEMDIKYNVSLLHHSCTLHCQVKGVLLNNMKSMRIMFVPFQGYILVVMPGVFTHLLDAGLEHEPCNHILLFGCELPVIQQDEVGDFVFYSNRLTKKSYVSYISCTTYEIKRLSLSLTSQSLLDMFNSSAISGTSVQQCIIHHLLVHFDEVSNLEMLLRNLTMDPTDPKVVKLFQEFLTGSSYFHAKNRLDKKFCCLLPISVAEPFHPQYELFLDGKMQMSITYTFIKNIKSILLSPTERNVTHHRVADLWLRLWQKLRTRPSSHIVSSLRFSPKAMRDELLSLGSTSLKRGAPMSPYNVSSKSFCPLSCISQECSLHPAASFCRQFLSTDTEKKPELGLECTNTFVPDDDFEIVGEEGYSKLEKIVSLNLGEITIHFSKNLPAAPPLLIKECASTYVAIRLDQSQVLCHIIFHLANIKSSMKEMDYDPSLFLSNMSSSSARTLFSWLERYLVAAEEIVFPLPKGFDAFFSVLAYKCLNIRMFLQYVDFGVVQLNSEVLQCITADAKAVVKTMPQSQLNDDNVIIEIISRLPKNAALHFLQHLKCHTTRLLQVHNIVERYFNHHCTLKTNKSNESKNANDEGLNSHKTTCRNTTNDISETKFTTSESEECDDEQNSSDFYSNVYTHPDKSKTQPKMPSRVPCASASDMKFIKDTQLRSIASEGSIRPRPSSSKIRPIPVVYWR